MLSIKIRPGALDLRYQFAHQLQSIAPRSIALAERTFRYPPLEHRIPSENTGPVTDKFKSWLTTDPA
jgi:hypothetical protein